MTFVVIVPVNSSTGNACVYEPIKIYFYYMCCG